MTPFQMHTIMTHFQNNTNIVQLYKQTIQEKSRNFNLTCVTRLNNALASMVTGKVMSEEVLNVLIDRSYMICMVFSLYTTIHYRLFST